VSRTALPGTGRAPVPGGGARSARLAGYGFVAPGALLVALLLYLPFFYSLALSFTDYDGLHPSKFVGFDNFVEFAHDPALLTSVRNTLMWVVGGTVLPVALGLLVAVLSHGLRHGIWYRVPFLLPYALSGAGLAVIWGFILQHGGAANQVLTALHVPGGDTSFLQHGPTNTIVMILAMTWQQLGVNALLFMVGLQSIPVAPLEAARIDGAGSWQLFRRITWPLLRPLTTVVIGLSLVANLKTFDIVWVTTEGGPGRSSETLAVTMYRDAFVSGYYGEGAAVAVALTLVTGLVSVLYLRRQLASRREVS
jgi:ABC-type sugar transport system permease subunit